MNNREKINIVNQKLSSCKDIGSLEEGVFQGKDVLKYDYYITKTKNVQCIFVPEINSMMAFIPTDNTFTEAQWKYLCKEIEDEMHARYNSGVIKSVFDIYFENRINMIVVSFPVTIEGNYYKKFNIDNLYQGVKEFKTNFINVYSTLLREQYGYLQGKIPSPIDCSDKMYIKNNIESKSDLLMNVVTLFYQMAGAEGMDASVFAVMSLKDLSELFKIILEYNQGIEPDILMALKKYYSPSTWFNLSEKGQKNFYEDLRIEFLKVW